MTELEVLSDAAVLIDGARIAWVGPRREARDVSAIEVVEVNGVLFPGFVDCHTHAVFGAPRLDDHERRALGADYRTIAATGGGIFQSVQDARGRSEAELLTLARARLGALLHHGSTTIEVKSGYGLDLETELKQLRVVRALAGAQPATLEARAVLTAARRHGLALKLHADELEGSGGAELAVELGALSADHLAAVSEAGIRALGTSATVAVLLPATLVFLGRTRQAPARRLLDAGAAVALASDFNPGSSPTVSLPFVMVLAVAQLGLRYTEAVLAITVNAAAALGLAGERGQIAPGFAADLVLCDVSDWREVAYWVGANLVTAVWTAGSACLGCRAPVSLGLHVQA